MTQSDEQALERPELLIPDVYDESFEPDGDAYTLMYVFRADYRQCPNSNIY